MWTSVFVMMGALIVLSLVSVYLTDKPDRNHAGVLISVIVLGFVGSYGFNVLAHAGG